MSKATNKRRSTLKLVLAGVAIAGVGAAITTAVWTDDVFFSATATASSFDLQGRAVLTPADAWQDIGVPGETTDVAPIDLDPVILASLAPDEIYDVPFELCNVGTTDGTITEITAPVLTGDLSTSAGGQITLTITGVAVTDALPSDTACATPIVGNLHVVTSVDFPGDAQGDTGTISFSVTGTSN